MTDYVDSNGNFTHTKLQGSPEAFEEFKNWVKEKLKHKNFTDSQMILINKCIDSGIVPNGLLLELIMPSTNKKFSDIKNELGEKITFDLPPKYRKDD